MKAFRRLASVVTVTIALAAFGLAAMPVAQAGLPEAGATPPAAYTIEAISFPDACVLQALDLATGTVTPLGGAPSPDACVIDLAVAPDGSVWGIGPAPTEGPPQPPFLTHFDQNTGEVLSSIPFTGDFDEVFGIFGGIAFDAAGTLYAQLVTTEPGCDDEFVCLYTVDPATGVSTFVGAPGADFGRTTLVFLAADCGGSMLTIDPALSILDSEPEATETSESTAAADAEPVWDDPSAAGHDDTDSLASYDLASGLLSEVAHFADPAQFVVGLDYSRDGTLYALVAPRLIPGEAGATAGDDVYGSALSVELYTVDPATAEVTLVAPLSAPESDLATIGIAGDCAPEPVILQPTFTG